MRRSWTGLVLALALLPTACGASHHEASAPPPVANAEHPAAGTDTAAEAASPAEPQPSAAEVAVDEEAEEKSAEPRSAPGVPGTAAELRTRLREERASFEGALQPDELSCPAAQEHLDAICRIAERICTSSEREPSSGARLDCFEAREQCTSAKARFARRCSAEP